MYIKNLGNITEGRIHFNDLVVIWGRNNSGKTMLTYLLYAIREEFRKFSFDFSYLKADSELYKIVNKGESIRISYIELKSLYKKFQNYFEENSSKILSKYYEVDVKQFEEFQIKFEDDEIYNLFPIKQRRSRGRYRQLVNGKETVSMLLLEATKEYIEFGLHRYDVERNLFSESSELEKPEKIALQFSKEQFDKYLSGFIKFMSEVSTSIYFPAERIGINQFRKELKTARASSRFDFEELESQNKYPIPVEDYIRFIFNVAHQKITEEPRYLKDLQLLNSGEFIFDENSDEFLYKANLNEESIPFNVMSSSLKSLLGFTEYLKQSQLLRSSMVFIDEPEMNLHPEKQVELMELLEKIILEQSTKVILSTHSSFITRKLLNILLSSQVKNKEIHLSDSVVNIYEICDGKINKCNVIKEHDFIRNFDEISEKLDSEYFSLINRLEGISD